MNVNNYNSIRSSINRIVALFVAISILTILWYTYQESIEKPGEWAQHLQGHVMIIALMLMPLFFIYRRTMVLLEEEEFRSEELALLSMIVEQSPVSIVIADKEGDINYVNDRFCELTGYTKSEAIGQNPRILKTDITPPERFSEMWKNLSEGKGWRGEVCNKKKDGSNYWEMAYIFPVYNSAGELNHYAGIKEDITERKLAQEALLSAKMEAEEANRSKSLFLATMSHEIRTPMNAILGMSYLALQSGLSAKPAGYVEKVIVAARSLLAIINDILDFSKIESGKMELEKVAFSIPELLEGVKSIVEVAAIEKGIPVNCYLAEDLPNSLVGDPLRLRQILINLAGNAVKFTESGKVEISVIRAEKSSQDNRLVSITFSVSDSGIGMDDKELKRIFSPFEQGDSSITRRYGGTGLGLSIVKTLVDMMGGALDVESKKGGGSRFSFTLEFSISSEADVSITTAVTADYLLKCAGSKILVVDDNQVNRMVAQEMLSKLKMNVTAVNNGKGALALLSAGAVFDLVFMDIMMTGMNGYETTANIRKIDSLKELPVIALSGFDAREDRERFISGGMNDLLSKPIEPLELRLILAKWLKPTSESVGCNVVPISINKGEKVVIPNLPGFNLEAACRRLGGDRDLLLSVISDSADYISEGLQEVMKILDAENLDHERGLFLLHSLAGSCGNIGAVSLYSVVRKGENLLREKFDPDELESLRYELELASVEFFSSLALLDVSTKNSKTPMEFDDVKPADVISILQTLKKELAGHRGSALTTARSLCRLIPFSEERVGLEKAIKGFEFKRAGEFLSALVKKLHIKLGE